MSEGGSYVSIIRVGLAQTKKFADGYDAIFGKKKAEPAKKAKVSIKSNTIKKSKAKKK